MSSVLVSTAIAVILWGNLIFKMRRFRGYPHDGAQRANCVALLFMALTFTLLDPPIYARVDGAIGIPNIARLLGNGCGVVAAWAFEPVATRLAHHARRTRRAWVSGGIMVVTLVVMAWLFFHADLPVSAPGGFPERYDTVPTIAAYRSVFLCYIGLACCWFFVLWYRQFGAAIGAVAHPALRRQVRLQAVGWMLGAAYCAYECVYILLRVTRKVPSAAYSPALAYGLLAGCFAMILSDGFFTGWAWVGRYRTYRLLAPLWRDLFAVIPGIALDPPRSVWTHAAVLGDIDYALYRRVTEIRDGVVVLQPYLDVTMVERARRYCQKIGIARAMLRQYVEAFALAAAIRAIRRDSLARRPLQVPLLPNSIDLDGDLRELRSVATAYRRVAPIAVEDDERADEAPNDRGVQLR